MNTLKSHIKNLFFKGLAKTTMRSIIHQQTLLLLFTVQKRAFTNSFTSSVYRSKQKSTRNMSQYATPDNEDNFTTNAKDQEEAAKLKARLEAAQSASTNNNTNSDRSFVPLPSISIAEGAHKYVLISATEPQSDEIKRFVISSHGAPYHRNVAEPFVERLENKGYQNIKVTGGGRIFRDSDNKKISIFGFSYGFGQAKHEESKAEVENDTRFSDYDVTYSYDGY